jgi:hypothetical protein
MSHNKRAVRGSRMVMWGRTPLRQAQGRLSAVQSGAARWFAMLLVLSLASIIVVAQSAAPAKTTEDLPSGAMEGKASASCLECHEARIILQQRLSKAAWAKEVDKMVKWGAAVDSSDRDALIDYLSANFGPDQPGYEPPRTSSDKASGKSGEKKAK